MGKWHTNSGLLFHIKSQHGRTPLMFAVQSGMIEVVKLLVSNGADSDVDSVDNVSLNSPKKKSYHQYR
jgi:ankyrin repeat protein